MPIIQTFIWSYKFTLSLPGKFSLNHITIIMKLQQLVTALDAQVAQGDIIGAFQKYAADQCVTLSNDHDKTHSKSQKLEALRGFFNNIARINRVELLAAQTGENVTDSQFEFDFTNRQGEQLVFNEVIRRTWQNDQVVEEYYLLGASLGQPAPQKTVIAKETASKAGKSVAEPKADKKPATKSAKSKLQGELKAGK